ncbi:MAG: ABC transporter ATP-binding protein [Firmicutes bacterium]|nr:ABC transporter ATP-binding protein [Bacillota bacterium]
MERNEKKQSDLVKLLNYTGNYKSLTFMGLLLSAIAMIMGMAPYICIWLVARDLIEVAPNWTEATSISGYGWMAFAFAVGGIVIYFFALMCTHLAAFRTASNIRKHGMAHLMKTPMGYFDNNASGLIRNRLNGAASETETLLAHNLADIVGTVAMFIAMIVLMFVFDWRMGAACILAAVISVVAMFSMMGGKNAGLMAEYQAAQDVMSKAGTEYVRGIPVVKVFQQTVNSFKAFKKAIEDYSEKAGYYQGDVCRIPQAINLTFTEGAFIFLIPVALFIAPKAVETGNFAEFVTDFAFYAVFSAIISTALAKVMFAASGTMLASAAMTRINYITDAPIQNVSERPESIKGNTIEFKDVTFSYSESNSPALSNVSFRVESGETVALVGPSGGGKTTAASLIPRFWDAGSGTVEVGGVDVTKVDPRELMSKVAFVFQNNRIFKTSILENVRAARPEASVDEVKEALKLAQCDDIIAKLPEGIDTKIGTEGTYLSGGETQRIAIARAILKDAPIVVLDEATAFADPENEIMIQEAFKKLMEGRTVIMIAHRLSTVVGADRIIVLNEGRVEESGTHEELVSKGGLYSRMWEDYNKAVQWKIGKEGEAE